MSDYMFALESHLDAAQNRTVAEIQRIATEGHLNVWLAGGAMRDMLRIGAPRSISRIAPPASHTVRCPSVAMR